MKNLLFGGNWCNGTSATQDLVFGMKYVTKESQEYMKVANVIASCDSYKQTFMAEIMIGLLQRKHGRLYIELYEMLYRKCNGFMIEGMNNEL